MIPHSIARRWADARVLKNLDTLRYQLTNAQASVARLTQERDHVSNAVQTMQRLFDARKDSETARAQERRAHIQHLTAANEKQADMLEDAERRIRELETTLDGLGIENAELRRRLDHKQLLDEDRAHVRRMDGQGDDR